MENVLAVTESAHINVAVLAEDILEGDSFSFDYLKIMKGT